MQMQGLRRTMTPMRHAAPFLSVLLLVAVAACAKLSGLNGYSSCGDSCDSGTPERVATGDDQSNSAENTRVGTTTVHSPSGDATIGENPFDAVADAPEQVARTVDVGPDESGVSDDADAGTTAGPGPTCRATDGGVYLCAGGEHCCINTATSDSQCAAACTPPQYAMDCAGSKSTAFAIHPCGSQACCGQLTLGDGVAPNCSPTEITSSCASVCDDTPPVSCSSMSTIRLCSVAADCTPDAGETHGNNMCCRFGSGSVYWCVNPVVATALALEGNCLM